MITVSRRQNLTLVFEGQDEIAEGQRVQVTLRPLVLALEEEMLSGIFDKQSKDEKYLGDPRLINKFFRVHVIGWQNLCYEDGEAIPFKDEWIEKGLPDDIVVGFGQAERLAVFAFLVNQGSVTSEEDVEKSE